MYCVKCGSEIGEEAQFCPKCGTAQNQIEEFNTAFTRTADEIILTFNINNNYFNIINTDGKRISANKIFQKSGATPWVLATTLGLAFGLVGSVAAGVSSNWQIRFQLFKTKICFTRLNTLLKPTQSIFAINLNEIKSVAKTRTYTIMDKTEITLVTTLFGNVVFSVPGNMRDITVNLLLELIGLKNDE